MKLPHPLSSRAQKNQGLCTGFKIVALLALMAPSSQAATLFFDPGLTPVTPTGGAGTWDLNATANWSNGATDTVWSDAAGTADLADFAGAAGGAVTLASNLGALGLIFDTTGYNVGGTGTLSLGTSGITVNPATGTSTFSSTGGITMVGAQSWTVATGGTLAVSAPVANGGFTLTTAGGGSTNIAGLISGAGGLTVNSTGVTTLFANNTYTGATTIGAGGQLQISAAATETYGATGAVTDNGKLFLSPATGATLTYGAVIGGTGSLTKLGAGNVIISQPNTYSGGTTISAGVLNINSDAALGAVPATAATNITFTASSFLQLSAATTLAATRNITLNNAATTASFDSNGNSFTVNGVISGVAALRKVGLGTLFLNGNNTFTGAVSFSSAGVGPIQLSTNNGLGTGTKTVTIASTVTGNTAGNVSALELTNNITIPSTISLALQGRSVGAGFAGLRNVSGNNTFAGNISITAAGGAYAVDLVGGNLTLSGTIMNTVNLPRGLTFFGGGNATVSGPIVDTSASFNSQLNVNTSGTGVVTVTGANTFTGPTGINSGVLTAASTTGKALGNTSNIAINGGGTLILGTANQVNAAAPITLGLAASTGLLRVATGANQGTAAVKANGVTPTTGTVAGLGALTLSNTATLTYNGVGTTLVFGLFTPNGNVLNIMGYTNGTATADGLNSGGAADDRLVFSGAQAALTAFAFNGQAAGFGVTEIPLDGGFYEVTFTAVPEPGAPIVCLLGLGVIGFAQRRRLSVWLGTARRS